MKLDVKYIVITVLIIALLVGVLLHIKRINNIKKELVNTEVESIRELTPIIDTIRGNLIITIGAIKKSEEQINFLKTEMKDLRVDTLTLKRAIEIIKEKKLEKELLDANGDLIGTKF